VARLPLLSDVIDFLLPDYCAVCGEPLTYGEQTVCLSCLNELPFTGLDFSENNPVTHILQSKFPVYKATALLIYHKHGYSGKLIHALKYEGKQKTGLFMARYLTPVLQSDPPDIIIPIPLHKKKLKRRGYNQLELFGKKLAANLGARYRDDVLFKKIHTESQTTKSPVERWQNVKKSFAVKCRRSMTGKHVLLIDDVLTTGATLSAAAEMLLENCPDIRLSVAVMAFNWH